MNVEYNLAPIKCHFHLNNLKEKQFENLNANQNENQVDYHIILPPPV